MSSKKVTLRERNAVARRMMTLLWSNLTWRLDDHKDKFMGFGVGLIKSLQNECGMIKLGPWRATRAWSVSRHISVSGRAMSSPTRRRERDEADTGKAFHESLPVISTKGSLDHEKKETFFFSLELLIRSMRKATEISLYMEVRRYTNHPSSLCPTTFQIITRGSGLERKLCKITRRFIQIISTLCGKMPLEFIYINPTVFFLIQGAPSFLNPQKSSQLFIFLNKYFHFCKYQWV
jgi:hypothetical protein